MPALPNSHFVRGNPYFTPENSTTIHMQNAGNQINGYFQKIVAKVGYIIAGVVWDDLGE